MEIIKLRGHRLERIEMDLLWDKQSNNALRKIGEYSYFLHFQNTENYYSLPFAQNCFKIHKTLFEENPIVKLTNKSDDICNPKKAIYKCPYLVRKRGIECKNPYGGSGDENPRNLTKLIKKADINEIQELGFSLGDEVIFSEILRKIINRGFLLFGYDDPDLYKRDLDKIFHPKIIALYEK